MLYDLSIREMSVFWHSFICTAKAFLFVFQQILNRVLTMCYTVLGT